MLNFGPKIPENSNAPAYEFFVPLAGHRGFALGAGWRGPGHHLGQGWKKSSNACGASDIGSAAARWTTRVQIPPALATEPWQSDYAPAQQGGAFQTSAPTDGRPHPAADLPINTSVKRGEMLDLLAPAYRPISPESCPHVGPQK